MCQFLSHTFARKMDIDAINIRVRSCKVDIFESAGCPGQSGSKALRIYFSRSYNHHFARLNVSYIASADHIKSACLRSDDDGIANPTYSQRTKTERVAERDKMAGAQKYEGIRPLNDTHTCDNTLNEARFFCMHHKMHNQLAV